MFGSKDFKETYEEEKYKEKKLFKTIWQIISLRILPFFILRSTYDIECTFFNRHRKYVTNKMIYLHETLFVCDCIYLKSYTFILFICIIVK